MFATQSVVTIQEAPVIGLVVILTVERPIVHQIASASALRAIVQSMAFAWKKCLHYRKSGKLIAWLRRRCISIRVLHPSSSSLSYLLPFSYPPLLLCVGAR